MAVDDVCYEILDALVLQRLYYKEEAGQIKNRLVQSVNYYNLKGMEAFKSGFVDKFYKFLDLWIDDYNDDIQSVDEYMENIDEYLESLDIQKSFINEMVDTICNLLNDVIEIERFSKLKQSFIEN